MIMFEYWICDQADEVIFQKQCEAIEKNIVPLQKKKMIVDVDNSKIQTYVFKGKEIKVHNDYFMNEVYVKSEIELQQFFHTTQS